MKKSRRAKRMEAHHARKKRVVGLNLVSLMDIFTILVFFLLVNSSNVQQLPNNKDVKLPEATVEKLPDETLVLLVSGEEILVQGRRITDVPSIMELEDELIPALKDELDHQAKRQRLFSAAEKDAFDITILGDREIPYKLLRRIMITCSSANYTNISLAVQRKAEKKG